MSMLARIIRRKTVYPGNGTIGPYSKILVVKLPYTSIVSCTIRTNNVYTRMKIGDYQDTFSYWEWKQYSGCGNLACVEVVQLWYCNYVLNFITFHINHSLFPGLVAMLRCVRVLPCILGWDWACTSCLRGKTSTPAEAGTRFITGENNERLRYDASLVA